MNGCLGPAGVLAGDQRGFPRVIGVRCDAGAFEYGFLLRLPLMKK